MADANSTSEVLQTGQASSSKEKQTTSTFKNFFEISPPDTYVRITDLQLSDGNGVKTPDLSLYCEKCDGTRVFHNSASFYLYETWRSTIVEFVCRNCTVRTYRFAIAGKIENLPIGIAMKYGQIPTFGPSTPARLIRLVEADRELFLQGRRCEIRGFGIGAFAYYRRVVENQRNSIIEAVAKAIRVVGSTPEIEALLKDALAQFQFSKSVEMLKDVIPQALLINGENPLLLLHSALSKGLHDPEMTDQHCLALAQSIRAVLTELAERVATVTKEDKELVDAIKILKAVPRGVAPSPKIAESMLKPESVATAEPKNIE